METKHGKNYGRIFVGICFQQHYFVNGRQISMQTWGRLELAECEDCKVVIKVCVERKSFIYIFSHLKFVNRMKCTSVSLFPRFEYRNEKLQNRLQNEKIETVSA